MNDFKIILLIIIVLILLTIKIILSFKKNIFLNYLITPLILFTIILIPLLNIINNPGIYPLLITIGIILSLIGDIFNLFEKQDNSHLFHSIIFFFFTHLVYTIAFIKGYVFSIYQVIFIAILIIAIIYLFNKFKININFKFMKSGILFYMINISLTLVIASGNLFSNISIRSLLIFLGILMLWLSDLFLGINAFIKKFKYGSFLIWLLYAPGQLLIALSTCY